MMQLLKKISIKIQVFFNHPKEGFSERYIMILFHAQGLFRMVLILLCLGFNTWIENAVSKLHGFVPTWYSCSFIDPNIVWFKLKLFWKHFVKQYIIIFLVPLVHIEYALVDQGRLTLRLLSLQLTNTDTKITQTKVINEEIPFVSFTD